MRFPFLWVLLATFLLSSCVGGFFSKRLIQKGEENFRNGKYREAIANYNNAILWNHKQSQAYLGLAKIFDKQQQADEALKFYEKTLRFDPYNKEALYRISELHFQKKNYSIIVNLLQIAIDRYPKNDTLTYFLALGLIYSGNAQEALWLIDQFESEQKHPKLIYAKGLAADSLELYDYAAIYFRQAIEADSLNQNAYISLVDLWNRQGDLESIKSLLPKAIILFRNKYFLDIQLSLVVSEFRWNEAISLATTLYNLTSNLDYIEKRARYFQIQGLLLNALNDYNFILSVDPNRVSTLFNRAVLQMRLGNESSNFNDIQRFLELADSTTPEWQIARAREIAGQYQREIASPRLKISFPLEKDKKFLILESFSDSILIRGKISKNVLPQSLTINGIKARFFNFTPWQNDFVVKIKRPANDSVIVQTSDIYGNIFRWDYLIVEREKINPEIILFSPTVDSNEVVQSFTELTRIPIKFLVADQNFISKVSINDINVQLHSQRTVFIDTLLAIPQTDTIIIMAEDIFGNRSSRSIILNSQNVSFNDVSKNFLWIIFEGKRQLTKKTDIQPIDSINEDYSIKVIEKKDVMKRSLEQFLLFELPSKLSSQEPTHLVLFFNGDCRIEDNKLYWYPIDAKDNRVSLFNTSFLSILSENLKNFHTLTAIFEIDPKNISAETQFLPEIDYFFTSPNTPDSLSFFTKFAAQFGNHNRLDFDRFLSYLSTSYPKYYRRTESSGKTGNNSRIIFRSKKKNP